MHFITHVVQGLIPWLLPGRNGQTYHGQTPQRPGTPVAGWFASGPGWSSHIPWACPLFAQNRFKVCGKEASHKWCGC